MQNFRLTAILALMCTSINGCSLFGGGREQPSVFLTRISESGLKHFELRYRRNNEDRAMRSKPGGGGGSRQNDRPQKDPAREFERDMNKMRKSAEKIIEENAYCRSGFWVLDFDADTRGNYLRGECNELATEADRVRFKDTIKHW